MSAQRITGLTPIGEVLARAAELAQLVAPREMSLADAEGRVLAADILARRSPAMPVALIDGWAVCTDAVADAGPYAPVLLKAAPVWVEAGNALPRDTDAVLPVDAVTDCEVHAGATAGDGVIALGADAGDTPLRRARERLRASDVAALKVVGVQRASVREPRVRVVSVGSDSAALAIARGVAAYGANVIFVRALERALADEQTDLVISVGGTGTGQKDESVAMLARIGDVHVHGFGISPGETSALGIAKSHPVLMLPARLDAALAAFLVVGDVLLRELTGGPICPGISVTLSRKIASAVGIAEVVPVSHAGNGVAPLASGYWPMQALTHAVGWVYVPPESEGYAAGASLEMRVFP